jgi:hypothetical protein
MLITLRTILADSFFSHRNAGAVHQSVQAAELLERGVHRGLAVILAGDIAFDETRVLAEFRGQRFALRPGYVGDDRVAAGGNDHFHGGAAQTRGSAGDDEGAVPDFHC